MDGKRVVTVRHATLSNVWCIEVPHPVYNIPQAYFIGNRHRFKTRRAAKEYLETIGLSLIKVKGANVVFCGGQPLAAGE